MGWLADRVKRVPIVGVREPRVRRSSCSCPASRSSAFMLFWTRFATGIAKANSIPVHQSLIADNYPIGIRARMSAVMQHGRRTASGSSSPVLVRRDRDVGGRRRGLALGVVPARHPGRRSSRSLAFFMKEPPRGQFEKEDVLGEVIEDEQPGADLDGGGVRPASRRSARSAPCSSAFCALGFGLFSQRRARVALPRRHPPRDDVLERGLHPQPVGHRRAAAPAVRRALLRPRVPQEPGQGARARRRADPAVGALHAAAVSACTAPRGSGSSRIPQAVLTASAFAMVGPVLQAVCPYRLRGMGTAMATMYIFFIGGFGGGIVVGLLHRRDRRPRHRDRPRRARRASSAACC